MKPEMVWGGEEFEGAEAPPILAQMPLLFHNFGKSYQKFGPTGRGF